MFSVGISMFGWGLAVGKYEVFPYRIFTLAGEGARDLATSMLGAVGLRWWGRLPLPWYYVRVEDRRFASSSSSNAGTGLNLVTRVDDRLSLVTEIVDMEGNTLHSWDLDWFKLWPVPSHLPAELVPKRRPGTHIHGAALLDGADLVFNFEHLGMLRVDRSGAVVWRLSYRTHHSVHVDNAGHLWACGQRRREEADPNFPDRVPPFDEYTIVEVSPTGDILQQWSIPEILTNNDREGLLRLWHKPNSRSVSHLDDRVHLNDVEPFDVRLGEGFFTEGDILVSLRNVNTVFVFSRDNGRIKYHSTGLFTHQHDPDFVDGNRFSVFDNKAPDGEGGYRSRIVIVSAPDDTIEIAFTGAPGVPFYTDVMGKHQWLPNGNLLITESMKGRAFEVDGRGNVVWEYVNLVEGDVVGLVEEVQRIPRDAEAAWRRQASSTLGLEPRPSDGDSDGAQGNAG